MICAALSILMAAPPVAVLGPEIVLTLEGGKKVTIVSNQKESPKTVAYVSKLITSGFYTGIRFHRVEPWVVQWGDPISKKDMNSPEIGSGGTGHSMPFEASKVEFKRGVVGIASTGAREGGDCQLFILTKDAMHLNGSYAVLGRVTKGMEIVDKITVGTKVVSMSIGKKAVRG